MKQLICLLLSLLMLCALPALAEPTGDDGVMREGLSALELTRLMGNGTNLGNTFEACDNTRGYVPGNSPMTYEVSWGAPVTTQEMLTGMKAAGFDTIRIPVFWGNMMVNDGTYTINPDYMARVREIVDYAQNAGLYTVINIHHFDEFIIRRNSLTISMSLS